MFFSREALPAPVMRAVFFVLAFFLPLSMEAQSAASSWSLIWGTDTGLYCRNQAGREELLWSGGNVQKIIRRGSSGWTILTDRGIWVSENLTNWEQRNQGLPEKVIKVYEKGEKSFVTTVEAIKDVSVDGDNPEIMVCAVKDAVYLTRNGGRSWQSLGMPNYRSNGIKAVAVRSMNGGGLTVFCSHSIYGVYYIKAGTPGAAWIEISRGFENLETTNNPDEISSFAFAGDLYAAQSFRRRLYKLDWESKTWNLCWTDGSSYGAADSLSPNGNGLTFVRDGGIVQVELNAKNSAESLPSRQRTDLLGRLRSLPPGRKAVCAVIRDNSAAGSDIVCLSELWLLDQGAVLSTPGGRAAAAAGKEGLYLPVNHAMDPASLKPYLDIIESRNLNMIVIDMKDDYGRLRFTPHNASIADMGRVFRPVDIDAFLKTMRERGIFTVARIVVFKDPEAARKSGAKYAVWDGPGNKPWEGYYDTRRKKSPEEAAANPALVTAVLPDDDPEYEILRTWYDEKWVDPYSEEIWDYNAAVAEELCGRGFDEIQFDYIRFPTDGKNLGDARYRWRDAGMDMDSAILSFLRHARSRVKSPISVDIYGANGWYRTGARTGQEVELLAPWVDVICPMYYPSHFEQSFLAQDPPELRPFRIYRQGTVRTHYIARGQVIVRPWAQAFYLNVSYDRTYYNADYVRRQLEGVRASGHGGLTYWNNSGRYEDIPRGLP